MSPGLRRRLTLARWAGLLCVIALGSAIALALGNPARPPRAVAVGLPAQVHVDAHEVRGPLDLVDAVLVQRDVRIVLRVHTSGGPWRAADLLAAPGRSLCVTLAGGTPVVARGTICLTRIEGHPALAFTPLQADGTPGTTRRLAAVVKRPALNVFEATFLPVAVGLSVGPYAWWVQSGWTDAAGCPSTCSDRLPDAGAIDEQLQLLGFVACFGAAARDPARPCRNPDLRLALEPPLRRARGILDPFCDARDHRLISVCAFGAAPEDAAGTFALIGDSHASGLKTALEVVTLAKRWRGVSMLRSACPATQAMPILPTRLRSLQCSTWNDAVLTWLAEHGGVDTVFLSTHTTAEVRRPPGHKMADTAQLGYRDEIRALLRSVRRVVVIRDTPFDAPNHLQCVARALRASRSPGAACARPRRAALQPDPLAAAARAMRTPRVQLIDLTRHVCDRRRCYPVVGGALVHRDETHVTPAFSATLGPYILRALKP